MSAVLRGDRTSAGGGTTGAIARRGVRGGVASAGGAAAFATIGALGLATVGVLAFATVGVLAFATVGVLAFATAGVLALATGGALTTGGAFAIAGAAAFASGTDDGARAATRGAGLGRDAAASAGVGTCDGCANISVSSPSFARSWAIRAA
jgi:hypothetical protein